MILSLWGNVALSLTDYIRQVLRLQRATVCPNWVECPCGPRAPCTKDVEGYILSAVHAQEHSGASLCLQDPCAGARAPRDRSQNPSRVQDALLSVWTDPC